MQNDSLDKLKEAVFQKRPVLKETYEKFKEHSLIDFIKTQYEMDVNSGIDWDRKKEVISEIAGQTEKLLGKEIAKSLSSQLETNYSVITTDHHGPLTDPGYFNSNILASLSLAQHSENRNILVLSCANISFDNDSFPRGHLFHSQKGGEIFTNQLVFFPRKVRPLTVFGHPSFTAESIEEARRRILGWINEGLINQSEAEKLNLLLEEIYADKRVFDFKYFSEQVTLTNFNLWKRITSGGEASTNLIYLEQEQIVNSLILKHHLEKKTLINQILLDEKYHELLIKYFDGILGGFSVEKKGGTFLFWGLPKDQKYRVQLWKEGSKLVTSDGSYSLELAPDSLKRALEEKELVPSTLLSFIILSFYYGLDLVGGGGQSSYFFRMKEAFMKMAEEIEANQELHICKEMRTDRLSFPYQSLAFLEGTDKSLIPATPLDVLIYGSGNSWELIKEMAGKITFEQGLLRQLPELYRMMFREDEQASELLNITQNEIDGLIGFRDAVQPVGML